MPAGRPTLYDPALCEQAFKLCLLGATNPEIAEFFEVAPSTVSLWMVEHPEFSDAVTRGRTQADAEIAHSMYKRAKGFRKKAVKIFMPAGAEKPVYAEYMEYYPPDSAAAMNWLANRQRTKWRKTQQIEEDDSEPRKVVVVNSPRG